MHRFFNFQNSMPVLIQTVLIIHHPAPTFPQRQFCVVKRRTYCERHDVKRPHPRVCSVVHLREPSYRVCWKQMARSYQSNNCSWSLYFWKRRVASEIAKTFIRLSSRSLPSKISQANNPSLAYFHLILLSICLWSFDLPHSMSNWSQTDLGWVFSSDCTRGPS